jgi:hypothetical protein
MTSPTLAAQPATLVNGRRPFTGLRITLRRVGPSTDHEPESGRDLVKVPSTFEQQDTSPRFVAETVPTPSPEKVSLHRIIVLRLFHGIRVLRELLPGHAQRLLLFWVGKALRAAVEAGSW